MAGVLFAWWGIRKLTMPKPPRPDAETFEQALRVRILRDTWGVPHVYGKTDGDAAFGLAYAHSEDDSPMLQAVFAASRGRLSLLWLAKEALANDYSVSLVGIREEVDAAYPKLSAEFRSVLEGYARGLNLYAYLHPNEADGRLPPFTGRDVAAAFAHKMPIMVELPRTLEALRGGWAKRTGDPLTALDRDLPPRAFPKREYHPGEEKR